MRICLFDIDGTLLSTGGAGKAAMEAALISEFRLDALVDGVPYSGRTDRAIGRDLLGLHGIEDNADTWRRLATAYLARLPQYLASHRGQVLPGIASLLQLLRNDETVLLGLLTGNIREGARGKLAHYGLWDHFALGGFGDDHFDRNDVALAAKAAITAHLDGRGIVDEVWVVGDTPLDIRCARHIGARVAAVATGWHNLEELAAAEPDVLLPDLSDPAPFLSAFRI
jgi:phosphoglycolate phosphatase-like HAD superfamily hydrolase